MFLTSWGLQKEKKNLQDIVRVVTGSKWVKYTPLRLFENETRALKELAKTNRKDKNIIFGNDTPIFSECLNEPRKQQGIDERVYN